MAARERAGVVLMNMGGPDSLAAIRPYLYRVLSDPRIVRLPAGFLYQKLFAALISRRRARKVQARYEHIGGRSPLLAETEVVARELTSRLEAPVVIAMRYSEPGAAAALGTLSAAGVTRVVAVPLYPQYSTSTTASSIADLEAHLPAGMSLTVVDRHPRAPGLVDVLARQVREALERAGEGTHLLFTAHSIPVAYTRKGDPYIREVEETVAAVVARAGVEGTYELAFQSAPPVGTWHGPDVAEVLPRLQERGCRKLVVQPVSFISENLETLWDLDHVLRRQAEGAGITAYVRLPAPGRDPVYAAGLADLVRAAQRGGERDG